ncbi:MAG TPA: hypothetical protein VFD92_21525 [Candidatus Binatia bacterium]|nr:hypothetical protein [Candidatus Binatia bacterium]
MLPASAPTRPIRFRLSGARFPGRLRKAAALAAIAGLVALLCASPARAVIAEAVDAGAGATCALTATGGVKCWGLNDHGQLGDGTTTDRTTPVDVIGLTSGVTAVGTGLYFACALTSGGGVKCWGDNTRGQLGDGTTTTRLTPVDVTGGLSSGVTAIAVGGEYACAIGADFYVRCWGENASGQFGNGVLTDSPTPTLGAFGEVEFGALLVETTAIDAGFDHACAVDHYAEYAACWGANSYGETGNGDTTSPQPYVQLTGWPTPVQVSSVAAGIYSTCAVTTAGGAKCWGFNGTGQLGDGTSTDRHSPVDVSGLASGVAAITTSGVHACALTTGGAAKCWGSNASGSVGDGTTVDRLTPVDVTGLSSGVRRISAGGFFLWHTCAVMNRGGIKCWGNNAIAQLGDGTTTDRVSPVEVAGFDTDCAAIGKPKLVLTKMNTVPGDDTLTLSGEMLLPYPFAPAVDPLNGGVRLAIYRKLPHGAALDDATISGAAYSAIDKKGWKVNAKHTVWTYTNTPNDLPSKITKVQVKLDSRTAGLVKFSAKGKAGSFGVAAGETPVTMVFSLESPFAANKQCAVERFAATFPARPSCFFNGPGSTLLCR